MFWLERNQREYTEAGISKNRITIEITGCNRTAVSFYHL